MIPVAAAHSLKSREQAQENEQQDERAGVPSVGYHVTQIEQPERRS
jgi:hypothetical protein